MAVATPTLTYEEFVSQYGDKTHEYWYGEAIPKGMPTIVHGLLQKLIMRLLDDEGLLSMSEVELRVDLRARPRPDVIAFSRLPREEYPTLGPPIVVEIISEDDKVPVIREHCQKYELWGCEQIYLVDPSDRSVVRWDRGSQIVCSELAGIPVGRIWSELDKQFAL